MNNILRAVTLIVIAFVILLGGASSVLATNANSVVVCKYVGTPGVDESLQTGQNPIVVDSASLSGFDGTFPFAFNDAQGQSIAIRYATSAQDGSITECPGYVPPPTEEPTPSTEPTPTPSPSVSPTPTPTPTNSPQPSATNSPTPSEAPTSTPPTPTLPPTDTEDTSSTGSGGGGIMGLLAVIGGIALIYALAETVNRAENSPPRRR